MANKHRPDPYSEEVIKEKRTFPAAKSVGIALCLALQILALIVALTYTPKPQDRIEEYELIATPRSDGAVDLEYRFVWTPLDTSEDLTWIDIGMANQSFTFYENSFSSNIESYEKYIDGDYVSARLYLDRPYRSGETLTFSFRVRQRQLLCLDDKGYFYEFVPGWFNATPVEHYRFLWKSSPEIVSASTDTQQDGYYIWEGSMPCGTFVNLQLHYENDSFLGASTVKYEHFYEGDVFDELENDKIGAIVFASVLCVILLILQIYMVDSVVSYHRGRGFLTGYGHHVHIYGRTNPKYEKEKEKHSSRGGRSGGGCACACACACAGGGRAGCSQKDTHPFPRRKK